MKLADIEALPVEFLDIPTVAAYLGVNPQSLRCSIRKGVPWAYMLNTATFMIPRESFVFYHKYGAPTIVDGKLLSDVIKSLTT